MEMECEPTARLCRDVRFEDVRQHRPYIAVYRTVDDAPADLDAVEQLHKDNMIGKCDAALIDNADGMGTSTADGPPEHPADPRCPAGGPCRAKNLQDAAQELTSTDAAPSWSASRPSTEGSTPR
jgi:hypothetical protein